MQIYKNLCILAPCLASFLYICSVKHQKIPTLNLGGRLFPLDRPKVMGILNATPDSFFAASRTFAAASEEERLEALRRRVRQMADEGADIIDVGACSTRPGYAPPSAEEEMQRLRLAIRVCREEAPALPLSIDTFRADVARFAVEECGAHIINDISGGQLDRQMLPTVVRLRVPYVLTHWQQEPHYDNVLHDVVLALARQAQKLQEAGLADIIIDPGFGFGKSLADNYALLRRLDVFRALSHPILVGLSRKSMVYKPLGATPDTVLPTTSALHLQAILHGANILRVHDVKAAADVITISQQLTDNQQ